MKKIFVTGAAGFIGSNFVELALQAGHFVVSYDALTYAGNLENLQDLPNEKNHVFVEGKIQDQEKVLKLLQQHQIDWLVNFAAESHVDKSISGPAVFIDTNIVGTLSLLTAARTHFESLSGARKEAFRYLQISTDEVYGTLDEVGKFSETTSYQPNSPYSASKAGGDLLVRAWFHTYHLPVITTNCSNNYGPKQFPEKLIPHVLLRALAGESLPVYGTGINIRDWIHVKDHARGILAALEKGKVGETYCFGGNSERTNLNVVKAICGELDQIKPLAGKKKYEDQIAFVTDRPGHDFRYAIDDSKAQKELGYSRVYGEFEDGLKDTIHWYLDHMEWSKKVTSKPGVKIQYDWNTLKK
jgi:dTDP-glucose 4,6-dehydratase